MSTVGSVYLDSLMSIHLCHTNHKIGTFYANEDFKFVYINIPKNASTWTKNILESLNFVAKNMYSDHFRVTDKKIVTSLREPVDRWISGISEYFTKSHPEMTPKDVNQHMLDLIFKTVVFDEHTEKQILFLHGIRLKDTHVIKCDDDYSLNFSKFLVSQNIPNEFQTVPARNVMSELTLRGTWGEFFKSVLKDKPKYYEQLKSFYYADYDLLSNVNINFPEYINE